MGAGVDIKTRNQKTLSTLYHNLNKTLIFLTPSPVRMRPGIVHLTGSSSPHIMRDYSSVVMFYRLVISLINCHRIDVTGRQGEAVSRKGRPL